MKIVCVGRNYLAHAKELHNQVPTSPVLFIKPETALLRAGDFYLPSFSKEIHHEIELVVRINRAGKSIAEDFAKNYYSEIALGVDFTARDLQEELKKQGLPWEKSKGFDNSAFVGNFLDKNAFENIQNLDFSLQINQKIVQTGNTQDMIFAIDKIIADISQYFTLKVGDLIFTGTPSGVGAVQIGDVLEGFLEGQSNFKFSIR
jgi:2-keto-4-pentenoate hydratase/2-oxohepta-3-ene-1,7-dioic acid hydratase in catechol pathway